MATMRAPKRSASSLAADRVCDAFVKASLAGDELPFPDGSSVVPSDLVTEERIREAHAQGRSVVIVDEHENVTVLPSPDPALGEREWDRFWRGILTHWVTPRA
jgi:hypothetical protein